MYTISSCSSWNWRKTLWLWRKYHKGSKISTYRRRGDLKSCRDVNKHYHFDEGFVFQFGLFAPAAKSFYFHWRRQLLGRTANVSKIWRQSCKVQNKCFPWWRRLGAKRRRERYVTVMEEHWCPFHTVTKVRSRLCIPNWSLLIESKVLF